MADASTSTQIVIAVLGAGGAGAILAAVITGLFSKRKLGAEAAEIITNAAAGVVTQLNTELTRATTLNETQRLGYEAQIQRNEERWQARYAEIRATLQLHVAWDTLALTKLHDLGVDLPPVPPLLPPTLNEG